MGLTPLFVYRFSALTALFPVPTDLRSHARIRCQAWIRFLVFAILALCCAAMGRAQYVDASAAGEPVKLTALWRFHAGDDPAWAAPGFDDAQWTLTPPDKDPQRGSTADIRWGWYRIRVKLPATHESLALSLGWWESEIYADGRLVGTIGTPRSNPRSTFGDSVYVFPLPEDLNGRTITLAVRSPQSWVDPGGLSRPGYEPSIAPARIQWLRREAESDRSLIGVAPSLFEDVLSFCLGIFSFGLFLLDRRATEYGWAALCYLSVSLATVFLIYLKFHHGLTTVDWSLHHASTVIYFLAASMFVWKFIGTPRGALFKVAMWINAIYLVIALALFSNSLVAHYFGDRRTFAAGQILCGLLTTIVLICLVARIGISAVRGNRNAQLLFLPITFSWSIAGLQFFNLIFLFLGWTKTYWSFSALQLGQVTIGWYDIFNSLSIASMGLILALRFAASSRREQRLSFEMDTARRVQEQLVPVELPATQAFQFEAAYRPASEVGGDLYQVYPRADGSVMVLMGDVSGKGLKAAMLGTLLVGAAGAFALEELPPAQMLARLNRRLTGHTDGGFVTCLCCLIDPDGRLTLSNAGHLAPYRNGEEVPCASGLPLGLVAGAEYDETGIQLNEGDTVTFLSDGVVEARNGEGELFGFDRARAVSAQAARTIADQAAAFGQEDDISVLRLTLQPAHVIA